MRSLAMTLAAFALSGCTPDWGPANIYSACVEKIVDPTSQQIASCKEAAEGYKTFRP